MDIVIVFILGVAGNIISQSVVDNQKNIHKHLNLSIKIFRKKVSQHFETIKRKLWKPYFYFKCFMFPHKYLSEEGRKEMWNIYKLNPLSHLRKAV